MTLDSPDAAASNSSSAHHPRRRRRRRGVAYQDCQTVCLFTFFSLIKKSSLSRKESSSLSFQSKCGQTNLFQSPEVLVEMLRSFDLFFVMEMVSGTLVLCSF